MNGSGLLELKGVEVPEGGEFFRRSQYEHFDSSSTLVTDVPFETTGCISISKGFSPDMTFYHSALDIFLCFIPCFSSCYYVLFSVFSWLL